MPEHGDHLDHAHSSSYLIKEALASEGISITGNDSKIEQPKQEVLLTPEGHPILTVQSAQNYGLNFMSTMLGPQQVQFEGSELQAQETPHFPSFVVSSSIMYFLDFHLLNIYSNYISLCLNTIFLVWCSDTDLYSYGWKGY